MERRGRGSPARRARFGARGSERRLAADRLRRAVARPGDRGADTGARRRDDRTGCSSEEISSVHVHPPTLARGGRRAQTRSVGADSPLLSPQRITASGAWALSPDLGEAGRTDAVCEQRRSSADQLERSRRFDPDVPHVDPPAPCACGEPDGVLVRFERGARERELRLAAATRRFLIAAAGRRVQVHAGATIASSTAPQLPRSLRPGSRSGTSHQGARAPAEAPAIGHHCLVEQREPRLPRARRRDRGCGCGRRGGCPFLMRFLAMGLPMTPSPINPISSGTTGSFRADHVRDLSSLQFFFASSCFSWLHWFPWNSLTKSR